MKIAIKEEIKAHDMYIKLAKRVTNPETRIILLKLARQELEHWSLLEESLQKKDYQPIGESVVDKEGFLLLDVSNPIKITKNTNPREVILYAIREEENAANFYNKLADYMTTELESIFRRLATEEKAHKRTLEMEYERLL